MQEYTIDEIIKEKQMSYLELCEYLQLKYGLPNGNYFNTEACKSKNQKITRGNEGLFIHHIMERKTDMLSNPGYAIKQPFIYQTPKYLVYCNYVEHFLLHSKIVEDYVIPTKYNFNELDKVPEIKEKALKTIYDRKIVYYKNGKVKSDFTDYKYDEFNEDYLPIGLTGMGGIENYIAPEIADYFNGYEYKHEWRYTAFKIVELVKDEYIKLLKEYANLVAKYLFTNYNPIDLYNNLLFGSMIIVGKFFNENKI